jgi:hypothetical protein
VRAGAAGSSAAAGQGQYEMLADGGDMVGELGRGCRGAYRTLGVGVKVLCEASRWWVLK